MQPTLTNLWTQCVMRCTLLLCIGCLTLDGALAQMPGGVGQSIKVWYTMDNIPGVPTAVNLNLNLNADLVNEVPGGSLARYKATAPPPSPQPTYQARTSEVINNHQSIWIDDDWFECDVNIDSVDNLHVITVYKTLGRSPNNSHPGGALWGNGGTGTNASNIGRQVTTLEMTNGSSNTRISSRDNQQPRSTILPGGSVYIHHINYNENAKLIERYINGHGSSISFASGGSTVERAQPPSTRISPTLFIGIDNRGRLDQSGQIPSQARYLLAEFLVYSDSLTPLQRQKITTHMGINYGLTLAHDYVFSNDSIIWDHSNSSYNHNIVGVAYDFGTSANSGALKHWVSTSQSAGDYLTLSVMDTSTFYSDTTRRSLVVGHNNLHTNSSTPLTNVPHFFAGGKRLDRVWRCEQSGGYGDYQVQFDPSVLPSGFNENAVVLLIADDENFTSNVRAVRMPSISNRLLAEGISFSNLPHSVHYMTIAKLETALWVKGDGIGNVFNNADVVRLVDQVYGVNDMFGRGVDVSNNSVTGRNLNLPNLRNSDSLSSGVNSEMNFNPYVKFNDGEHTFIERLELQGMGDKASTIFLIVRRDLNDPVNSTGQDEVFFSYASHYSNVLESNTLLIHRTGDVKRSVRSTSKPSGSGISNNLPSLIAHYRGDNNIDSIYVNRHIGSNSFRINTEIPGNGTLVIGQKLDAIDDVTQFKLNKALHGDLAELIVLSKRLDGYNVQKVRSYLSIKYGILLENDFVYRLSDGTPTWSSSTNVNYHKNIAGIGRDDAFQLNQVKSRAQRPTTDTVVLTISTNNLPNLSHMIWGALNTGLYHTFSTTGAPTGLTISGRHWKVQNYGDKVGLVTVELDIPNGATNLAGARLIIDTDSDFSDATVFIPVSSSAGKLIFTGVNFDAVNYFTLGFETEYLYANNDAGAPGSFEACRGSKVTFRYDSLQAVPNKIRFVSKAGGGTTVDVLSTAITFSSQNTIINPSNPNLYHGLMNFTIPDEAATGRVEFYENSTRLYTTPNPLIIHNPTVDFYTTQIPMCATDTTELKGIPTGGYFYSPVDTTTIVVDSGGTYWFDARNAGWSSDHMDAIHVPVSYVYGAQYTTGEPCLVKDTITDTITVRDNRLVSIDYAPQYVTPNSSPTNLPLEVNSSIIRQSSPNLLSGSFRSSTLFSGSNTVYNSNTHQSGLLLPGTVTTSIHNQIYFQFNNQGCIADAYGTISVYSEGDIPGLPSTLCRQADNILFRRDSISILYTIDSNNVENNWIDYMYVSPDTSGAVTWVDSTPGAEIFAFDPTVYSSTVDTVTITISYSSGPRSGGATQTAQTTKTIVLVDPDTVRIDPTIPLFYCVNDNKNILNSLPSYDAYGLNTSSYRVENDTGLLSTVVFIKDTLITAPHYNNLLPTADQDLDVRIIYQVNKYGCVDRDTAHTLLVAPITMSITSASPFCLNEPNGVIRANAVGSAVRPGVGYFDTTAYIDSAGLFNAQIAGSGSHTVTYRITDQRYNCESVYQHDVLVRHPPQVQLLLDDTTNTSFCGSDTAVLMRVRTDTIGLVNTVRYFGAGVTDSIFNPHAVYSGNRGSSNVWTHIEDTFGCENVDSLAIQIIGQPQLDLDVAFNNRRRVLPNGNVVPHAYCADEEPFVVSPSPNHLSAAATSWRFWGDGITVVRDNIYFDVNRIPDSIPVATVYYSYVDAVGCSNIDSTRIKIDTVPDVQLNGLAVQYCQNQDTVHLMGRVLTPGISGTARFSGSGLDPVTGVFDPNQANTGVQLLRYIFRTSEGCEAIDEDTVAIYALPTPTFTGDEAEYCTNGSSDTLYSTNDTTSPSSYYFWGNIITDSSGILTPDTTYVGAQLIHYTYTDTNGCVNTTNRRVYIRRAPELIITGLEPNYCFNGDEVRLGVSHPASLSITGSAEHFGMSGATLTIDLDRNSGGVKPFILTYSDPVTSCSDSLYGSINIRQPSAPQYTNLASLYCEVNDTFLLTGLAHRGRFYGPGIIQVDAINQGFNPDQAGSGDYTITYVDTNVTVYGNDTLVCVVDTQAMVRIRPLPVPSLNAPSNNERFCSNDSLVELEPSLGINRIWHRFTANSNSILLDTVIRDVVVGRDPSGAQIIRRYTDTTYYFDPSVTRGGVHTITYIATNGSGCSDSIQYNFIVDLYQQRSFQLDGTYCESADSVLLLGGPPGGVFTRNGDTLVGPNGTPPYFVPNPGYALGNFLTSPQVDTVTYSAINGACEGDTTVIVVVSPVPQVSYTTPFSHNTYCLGMDAVPLIPDSLGGSFVGNGVLLDSMNFRPTLAGAGIHPIEYSFIDSATGCFNAYVDTLYVYGMPNVSYQVVGGCQLDSSLFTPTITGLGNTFQNRMIDSITDVQWILGPGVMLSGTFDTIQVDSMHYSYTTPGVYHTQLIVANRGHCIDTHTVRLVISPTITNYPYDETFEYGNGNWFAEGSTTSHPLLWEWGRDTTSTGFTPNPSNHIWATRLNAPYQPLDDAWVYSPCFDISSLERPMIHFDYWSYTPDQEDGTIIEYQRPDGSWGALGKVGRGLSWFNSLFIAGQPGGRRRRPIGWSGNTGWQNGRYKLDDYRGPDNIVRLRFAFGAFSTQHNNFQDGFAFDNVWIGDRTRNVLLETTSNIGQPNMALTNNYLYDLVYHTNINKDLVLVQYHTRQPDQQDQFYINANTISNVRLLEYGDESPGRAYIDGRHGNDAKYTSSLTERDFEEDMLQDPKFSITIDTFEHVSTTFRLVATVTALENMPQSDYRIYTMITEDSLYYQNTGNYPSMLQTVVRKDDAGGNEIPRAWQAGDAQRFELVWDHGTNGFINYEPFDFQGVVFIQDKQTEEVFQAATTRDVSGYWIGVDQTQPHIQDQYDELTSMVLFPNPAQEAFNVQFEVPLNDDYQWRLVDIRGVEVQVGVVEAGTALMTINSSHYPTGTYVLLLYNDHVFAQRKVIIRR